MIKFLWRSFWDIQSYKKILGYGILKTLAYFLLLAILSSAVKSVVLGYAFSKFISEEGATICAQVPTAYISKDSLKIEGKDGPVFIETTDKNMVVAGFTEKFFDSNELKKILIAFEKNRITISTQYGEHATFYEDILKSISEYEKSARIPILESDDSLKIDSQKAKTFLSFVKLGMWVFLPIFNFFATITYNIIIVLLISMPAYLMSLTRVPFGYFNALKIALMAATPAIIFQTLEFALFGVQIGGAIYAFLSFILVWKFENTLFIESNKKES